ncbi:MAG: carboxymuconolactone decarboxylase family protein [Deltaproteobacteria bacterium]|nr:carboxymuconolactone decarboxylase family protein [Deltaproteobacteria bacterium]
MNIKPVTNRTGSPSVNKKLNAVKEKLGFIPNLFSTLGNSETALDAYLSLSAILEGGELSPQTKERIALVTANHNNCEYCTAAHCYLAQTNNVPNEDILARGHSVDSKVEALIQFAEELLDNRGRVDVKTLAKVREVGYFDSELLEVVMHVTLNILTNYTNNLAKTEVDFPSINTGEAKAVSR